jgi:hypothetical protein
VKRIYYGWWIALAAFLNLFFAAGILYSRDIPLVNGWDLYWRGESSMPLEATMQPGRS